MVRGSGTRWFQAFAMALVLVASGCRWLPVQRLNLTQDAKRSPERLDPTTRSETVAGTSPTEPSLPILEPISDREALGMGPGLARDVPMISLAAEPTRPSRTPLLDAALIRARADQALMLSADEPEDQKASPIPVIPEPESNLVPVPLNPPSTAEAAPQFEPPREIEPPVATKTAETKTSVGPIAADSWERTIETLRAVASERTGHQSPDHSGSEARDRLLTSQEPSEGDPDEHVPGKAAAVAEGETGAGAPRSPVAPAQPPEIPPTASPIPVSSPPTPALAIADLALCRRVRGFADIEAIPADSLKAGQPVILYCQMDGLRYEPIGSGNRFQSRLTSRVELILEGQDSPVWSQDFAPAEDRCGRPRQDYYASYPLTLPFQLGPGRYQLRLIQTDLLANETVERALPVAIRP
jgi:hypothetical protein